MKRGGERESQAEFEMGHRGWNEHSAGDSGGGAHEGRLPYPWEGLFCRKGCSLVFSDQGLGTGLG